MKAGRTLRRPANSDLLTPRVPMRAVISSVNSRMAVSIQKRSRFLARSKRLLLSYSVFIGCLLFCE